MMVGHAHGVAVTGRENCKGGKAEGETGKLGRALLLCLLQQGPPVPTQHPQRQ